VQAHFAVRLVIVAGLALIVNLFLAPWYVQSFLIGDIEFTRTALEPPHGWLAVLAWLLTMALLAEVVLSRVSTQGLPDMPVPWVRIQIGQGFAILALLLFKLVATAGHFGWGSWVGVVLAAALAYGVWAAAQPHLLSTRGGRHE
jgi:hypothetical protein